MARYLSPVLRAIGKLGGVLLTAKIVGGGVTEAVVRYWLKRDRVPPEHAGVLACCSGIPIEEFAEHEKQKYLVQAGAPPTAAL